MTRGSMSLWWDSVRSMPVEQQRTLNWAAKYGGTLESGRYVHVETRRPITSTNYLPTGLDPRTPASQPRTWSRWIPATYELSGYAFLAADATALSTSLKNIFAFIAKKHTPTLLRPSLRFESRRAAPSTSPPSSPTKPRTGKGRSRPTH